MRQRCYGLVVVLTADRAVRLQGSIEVGLDHRSAVALRSEDHLDAVLIEDIDRPASHAAADDHIDARLVQEVGKEAGLVAGVCDALLFEDGSSFGFEDLKALTVAEVATDGLVVACDCNFSHFNLSSIVYVIAPLAQ